MTHLADALIDDLLVVIVLYQTRLQESAAYISLSRSLKGERCCLFIYDNSPVTQQCASAQWKITYVHDPSNPGVSKAYNEGFKKARELNKKWMLLADQDTTFPDNFFERYSSLTREFNSEILVPILKDEKGIVSPLTFYLGGGQRIKTVAANCKLDLRKVKM